ncbi:MAG: hypothetical protein Q8P45_03025 [Candidatus Harrisonbacteria bacterium]|nr:hypothetical protein [Candidatus Harrisonbacteria bacterium]
MLSPHPIIGGLEISHAAIRYVAIQGSRNVIQASVQLPPKVIQAGEIVDEERFGQALEGLHKEIAKKNHQIHVNVVISSSLVFSQPFSIPMLSEDQIHEAVALNLRTISPQEISKTYYDWQEIGRNSDGGIELLGAFAESSIIDHYTDILRRHNFQPTSIEFPGVAITRLLQQRWPDAAKKKNYLVVYINNEGVLFLVTRETSLYFHKFSPWRAILSQNQKDISFEQVQDFLRQELQRVFTFYRSRMKQPLKFSVLISPLFSYELARLIESEFSSAAFKLTLPELPKLSSSWFPALGAALRSFIPRSEDDAISLSAAGVKNEYYRGKTLNFIRVWRKFAIAASLFLLLAFIGLDTLFLRAENMQAQEIRSLLAQNQQEEFDEYSRQAQSFNTLLAILQNARSSEKGFSPVFENIRSYTGETIELSRIFFDASNASMIIGGFGENEVEALEFKNRLEADSRYINVSLPLSNIKSEPDGRVSFRMNLHLRAAFELLEQKKGEESPQN